MNLAFKTVKRFEVAVLGKRRTQPLHVIEEKIAVADHLVERSVHSLDFLVR